MKRRPYLGEFLVSYTREDDTKTATHGAAVRRTEASLLIAEPVLSVPAA